MSNLNVVNLQNPANPGNPNIILEADGTVTLDKAIQFSPDQTFPAQSGTTPPANPVVGSLWYDTNTNPGKLRTWSGSAWEYVDTGSVTQITTGLGLTGGLITTTGTIGLADTAVVPGTYTSASITVDSTGRITNAASTVTSGTVTSVGVDGGVTGLSTYGGPVTTNGTIVLEGVLNIGHGGTGSTTQAGALNGLLPPQSGQAGKALVSDGTVAQWGLVSAIPAGSVMFFYQSTAPTGWSQVTTPALDDSAIRIVTGNGGSKQGDIGFSTLFNAASTWSGSMSVTSGQVGATTLSIDQMPTHDHISTWGSFGGGAASGGGLSVFNGSASATTTEAGGDLSHTHSLIGVTAAGNFTTDFAVQYLNTILASKD